MRKSSAPSQRKNFISPLLGACPNETSGFSADKYKFISKISQSSKENLLKPDQSYNKLKQNVETNFSLHDSLPTRRFNVVYGKQSKKKHKTWEGDGIIEVIGKNITLKDETGKAIGQSTCKKNEELSDGIRIFVGSKEVEILDEIPSSCFTKKRLLDEDNSTFSKETMPINKKCKDENISNSQSSGCVIMNSNDHLIKKSQKNSFKNPICNSRISVEPLIMPRPSEEHQWQYNVNYLPVTDVQVDYCLTKVLRQHQREGVLFLYSCVTGIRSIDHTGAILADEMGLGKTLQCITLIWTLLKQGFYGGKPLLKRALIVVPSSLVKNWHNEFIRWIGSYRLQIFAVNKSNKIQNYSKSPFIPVVIISYEMFVKSYDLVKDIDFDLIICDEGHRLKNSNIQTTVLLSQLPCLRRILLTGTPVQNDLQEFFTLVNFVNPGILGSINDFKNNFEKIIEASRESKASEDVIVKGEEKSKELMKITNNFVLRRVQSVIGSYLPPKHEHVVFCSMSSIQKKLYNEMMDYCIRKYDDILTGFDSNLDHLSAITCLKKICNHPSLLAKSNLLKPHLLNEVKTCAESSSGFISSSIKLVVLNNLIEYLHKSKEKIVLVSNFTQTLDVLEKFCTIKNHKFIRFDGSTPLPLRNSIVSNFNSPNSDASILLLSSKAGGVGLNLIGASRLVLFDSDWNPATDLQAMSRIWRDGQKRNVYIYRFLTSGTIEEKIFQRQLKKAGLNESVVDPLAVSAVKFSKEELKDLFEFQESSNSTTHDLLHCNCDGNGCIPGIPQESTSLDSDFDDNPDEVDLDDFDVLSNDLNVKDSKDERAHDSEEMDDDVLCGRTQECDSDNVRDCEISFSDKVDDVKPKALRMNQLYFWEHHNSPISLDVLQEIGLDSEAGHHVNFLFRNKTI